MLLKGHIIFCQQSNKAQKVSWVAWTIYLLSVPAQRNALPTAVQNCISKAFQNPPVPRDVLCNAVVDERIHSFFRLLDARPELIG